MEKKLPRPPLSDLIDHIDHMVKIAGVDHVGLGSDFDGIDCSPQGMDSAADLPKITEALYQRGYKAADLQKILGGNLMRVFAEVEKTAKVIQAEEAPPGYAPRNRARTPNRSTRLSTSLFGRNHAQFSNCNSLSQCWQDSPLRANQQQHAKIHHTENHDCQTRRWLDYQASTTTAPKPVQAIFETTLGNITCTLFPDKAPITVDNFIGLATGTKDWKNPSSGATMHHKPLYDGTMFHRVIPNFMIQGGDPLGNGTGGPGYSFRDEFSDLHLRPARTPRHGQQRTQHQRLAVLHHRGPHAAPRTAHYTIFGQCDNQDLVKQIARLATDPRNDRPFNPPKITHVKIIDSRHPATTTPAKKPATGSTTHKSTTGTTNKSTTPPPKPQ